MMDLKQKAGFDTGRDGQLGNNEKRMMSDN